MYGNRRIQKTAGTGLEHLSQNIVKENVRQEGYSPIEFPLYRNGRHAYGIRKTIITDNRLIPDNAGERMGLFLSVSPIM